MSDAAPAAAAPSPPPAAEASVEQLSLAPGAVAEPTPEPAHPTGLTLDERFALARSVAEECINDDELRALLKNKPLPVAYDGFEPSGRMHIAQGVMKAINVNKLTKAGCTFKFWVADWFAQLNNKMGGDLKKIQTVGKYMVEVWKAVGMDLSKVGAPCVYV
ncbi:Tyrosine--tRNA ligase [Tetrabaena socialis]|uniref:tyrosine--tRNA ligase n=1 Tax=Tetrabaena socialis TaxID=47790 RepID=A0A2J8AHB7_9CHLO|nr:Tyrosine--tRNA ligase [Tetrabaena socialis]|eukprot:PNH11891.1 Tyrosine--tRNA ligase [Tetrabaena socialis]